jgi:tetratricopeptide (TPR) repeat protein
MGVSSIQRVTTVALFSFTIRIENFFIYKHSYNMRLHRLLALYGSLFAFLAAPSLPAQEQPDALLSYRTGRDLEARNRPEEANRHYNDAVRICTDEISRNAANMDSYTVLTWALQRQGKYADVISWGERGIRIGGNDYRIVETMGEAYFYLANYDESLRSMQRYVNSLPQGERASVAYFFIGEIYRIQRKFRHADIAYTTAVRLDPGLALWWYRLGSVRESVGEYAPAVEAYERALRLNPNYEEARQGLERSRRPG